MTPNDVPDLDSLSELERADLPPALHRPVFRHDIAPRPSWVCAVCGNRCRGELWPCPQAQDYGDWIALLSPADVQAAQAQTAERIAAAIEADPGLPPAHRERAARVARGTPLNGLH